MSDDIPLRDYVVHIYAELQGEIDRRYSAQEKAVTAATTALDNRLGVMNEFRAAIADTMAHTVTRDTFDNHLHSSEARFGSVETRLTTIEIATREQAALQAGSQSRLSVRLVALGLLVSVTVILVQLMIAHHVI